MQILLVCFIQYINTVGLKRLEGSFFNITSDYLGMALSLDFILCCRQEVSIMTVAPFGVNQLAESACNVIQCLHAKDVCMCKQTF